MQPVIGLITWYACFAIVLAAAWKEPTFDA